MHLWSTHPPKKYSWERSPTLHYRTHTPPLIYDHSRAVWLPFDGSWRCRWEKCLRGNPPLPSALHPIHRLKRASRHHKKTPVYLLFIRSPPHLDNRATFLVLL